MYFWRKGSFLRNEYSCWRVSGTGSWVLVSVAVWRLAARAFVSAGREVCGTGAWGFGGWGECGFRLRFLEPAPQPAPHCAASSK